MTITTLFQCLLNSNYNAHTHTYACLSLKPSRALEIAGNN